MNKKRGAYFSPCDECGLHGHIVLANGEKSKEFGTVYKGLEVLRKMLLADKVTRSEGAAIMGELEESRMTPRDDDEDYNMEVLLEMRGGTEEGFRALVDDVHRAMLAEEAEKKRTLQ